MRKVFYVFQVFLIIVFLVKAASLGGLIKSLGIEQRPLFSENRALAESPHPVSNNGAAIKDVLQDELVQPRNLWIALQNRQQELDKRESSIQTEEARLLSLKKEITEKIDVLLNLEQKLNASIGTDKEAEAKRYKDLAKVYEATPPAKAGAMLETLDLKTAAGITMHMKRDKAGAIWGFLSSQKAVEITKQITMSASKSPE